MKFVLMLTIFAVSVMSLHGVAVADNDNRVQNISVERSSTNVPSAVLSWDTQEGIKQYNIKYKCSGDDKENLRVPGNQSSYTFDVYADQSCKINIRSISDNGEKSDNVKIILASGEPTGEIAEDVKKSTGEIAEDVKDFTTRSGNAPADNTPPTLESAALDEKTGVLAITFDETIANEGFDLSTADYKRKFSVRSQDGTPEGVAFNPDGTKMFVVGYDTEKIYEYALTTPFDLSSSSYANRSFPVGSQDNSPKGVAFNPDGTKMFVIGGEYEEIHEYALTTPFDVSSSSYTKRSFPVGSEDNTPRDVAFNPAGTKMFVAGYASETIIEYTLSTAFNVSTASYTDTFDVSSQDTEPEGVAFNPDGTKMFVVGDQRDRVYEYTLTTPFDLSNVSYAHHFSVGTDDNFPTGVAFNPAGTKMFVVGADSNNVYEYALTTPVDLSKLLISESASVNGTGTALTGASIETVGNSTSIEIKLTAPQLQSVIALTNPELDILEAAVSDVSGNEILAAPNNGITVTNIAVTNSVAPPPLAAPTGLSVYATETTATLYWDAPIVEANTAYTSDKIRYTVSVHDGTSGTHLPRFDDTISDGITASYTVYGLIPGKTYTFSLVAYVNVNNVKSTSTTVLYDFKATSPSVPASSLIIPSHPVITLKETVSPTQVKFTIERPVNVNPDDIAYYVLQYACGSGAKEYSYSTIGAKTHFNPNAEIRVIPDRLGVGQYTTSDVGVAGNIDSCTFEVATQLDNGIRSSGWHSFTVDDVTPKNTQLAATMHGSDAIKVLFPQIDSDSYHYVLSWGNGSKTFKNISPDSYIIKDVIPGNTYTIVLTLYNFDYTVYSTTSIEFTVPADNTN